jgi:hypothetical protein
MTERKEASRETPAAAGSIWGGHLPLESETTWFILLSALDVFVTYLLVRDGRFVEGNPIARYFLNHWGVPGMVYFKFALVAVVVVIVQVIARRRPTVARRLVWFAILVVFGVVCYSLALFARHATA